MIEVYDSKGTITISAPEIYPTKHSVDESILKICLVEGMHVFCDKNLPYVNEHY